MMEPKYLEMSASCQISIEELLGIKKQEEEDNKEKEE